jgi:hypothetical protein
MPIEIHIDTSLPSRHIILTRYLYVKEEVIHTLSMCLYTKKKEEAIFWAYELYYSGWMEDLFQLFSSFMNPIIQSYYLKKQTEWHTSHDANIIGSIINSIILYHGITKQIKKRLFVRFEYSERYKTVCDGPPRKILERVCTYSTIKRIDHDICYKWYYKWLYYASFSPIWKERIEQYGGIQKEETCEIEFTDVDLEEEFYDHYWYEPDEQKRDIQEKMIYLS